MISWSFLGWNTENKFVDSEGCNTNWDLRWNQNLIWMELNCVGSITYLINFLLDCEEQDANLNLKKTLQFTIHNKPLQQHFVQTVWKHSLLDLFFPTNDSRIPQTAGQSERLFYANNVSDNVYFSGFSSFNPEKSVNFFGNFQIGYTFMIPAKGPAYLTVR